MPPRSKALLTTTALGLMTLGLGLLTAKKIDFMTADLGRHLANGRWLPLDWAVLSTNFYAHDYAMTAFVNHHWLSGMAFHATEVAFGFPGLSLAYLAMVCTAFALMATLAVRQGGAALGLSLSFLVLPLVAFRTEVRPEGFSYLLAAVFLWVLTNYRSGRYGRFALVLLPLLLILWVNLHIYFIFGLGMLLCFSVEAAIRHRFKSRPALQSATAARDLAATLAASLLATLVNPFGWYLALLPLHIFDNYGYLIAENQSVWFLERLGMSFPVFIPLYATTALFWLALLGRSWRSVSRLPCAALSIAALFSVMALLGIRNISLFGLFALPALAELLKPPRHRLSFGLALVLAVAANCLFLDKSWQQLSERFGIGLVDPTHSAATFFKKNQIKGPVFNNYDIGGYLIYHLYPEVPPFVDNRPEAYPPGFFQATYVPMQQDEVQWELQNTRFQFNSIFFYWHDMTPAAQAFLLARVQDQAWVPVYVDAAALILVRNTAANQSLISRYQIPRERFSTRR